MNVELIYDADCPNAEKTRSLLIKAFTQTGVSARWREWERSAPESPEYVRFYGSPTILVDGKDIAGVAPNAGIRVCRVYKSEQGNLSRTPPLEAICSALRRASSSNSTAETRWKAMVASFPAIGTALLPKLACPLCFPAYAAVLSALGLEFVNYTPYLLPLMVVFLALAIVVLALQTRQTGNTIPLLLGIAASIVVLIGKFGLEIDWLTTVGIVLLVVAVFLGSRTKSTTVAPCPACAAGQNEVKAEAR